MKSDLEISSNVSLKSFRISKIRCDPRSRGVVECCPFIVISNIQMDCDKVDIFALEPVLEKVKH